MGTKFEQRMAQVNQPVTCPRCGSQHFVRLTYNTFKTGGYGSQDIQEEGAIPTEMLTCVCGFVMKPNFAGMTRGTALKAREGISASLKAAQEYEEEGRKKTDLQPLLDQVVTREQFTALETELAELKAQVKALIEKK